MKSDEEIMEILEAYDLTGSYRDAGELAGCSHHTVAHHVEARGAGRLGGAARRDQLIDPYLAKLEAFGERSDRTELLAQTVALMVDVGLEPSAILANVAAHSSLERASGRKYVAAAYSGIEVAMTRANQTSSPRRSPSDQPRAPRCTKDSA